jgi:hypothetical protein
MKYRTMYLVICGMTLICFLGLLVGPIDGNTFKSTQVNAP